MKNPFSNKTLKKVEFPQGNKYEGSLAKIYYTDGSIENTFADTFYARCAERNLSKEEIERLTTPSIN